MAFQYETVNSGGMSTHYHARSLKKWCKREMVHFVRSFRDMLLSIFQKYIKSIRFSSLQQ
jgi:hypothetical protein